MRLLKLKIKNFKCFGEKVTEIPFEDMTVFVGENGCGKTAAMEALSRMFGMSTRERTIHRQDFHIPNDANIDEINELSLSIEAVFVFDEALQSGSGTESIPPFFDHVIVEDSGKPPILRVLLESEWKKTAKLDGSIDTRMYFIQCTEDEDIVEDKG